MKILVFLSLLMAYLLPNNNPPWNSFQSEILAIVFAFGLSLIALKKKTAIYSYDIFALSLLAVAFLYIIFDVSHFSTYFFIALLYLSASLSAFHFGVEYKFEKNYFSCFATALIVSALASLGIQFLQIYDLVNFYFPWVSEYPGGGRAFGNLGQPNQLSTLTVAAFLCGLYLNNIKKISNTLIFFLAFLFSVSLVFSGSKTAIVSMALAFIYLVSLKDKKILFLFLFFSASYLSFYFLFKGETRDFNSVDISTGRFPMWEMLAGAVKASPFLGYGLGNAAIANFEVIDNYPRQWNLFTAHSHNLILEFFIWFGIPLGLLFSIQFIAIVSKHFFYGMRRGNQIAASILLPITTHAMLEFPLHYAYFLIPFGYLVGVLWEGKRLSRNMYIFPLFSFLICFFGIGIFREYIDLEEKYMNQRFYLHNFSNSENQNVISSKYLDIPTSNFNFMTKNSLNKDDIEEMEQLVKIYPSYRNLYLLCNNYKNVDLVKFDYFYNKAIKILKVDQVDSFKRQFHH